MKSPTPSYAGFYEASLASPVDFWTKQATKIAWYKAPVQTLTMNEKGFYRWFEGGTLNTCYLALDYHVEHGRSEQVALIYDSPVTKTVQKYTYAQLQSEVAKLAGALRQLGVEKGDCVVIYMPMVPEAAFAMLACARLGAVHSVVFGGFAPHELAIRIDDTRPKVVISASCGIEFERVIPYKPLLDDAIHLAQFKPPHCLILQRPQIHALMHAGRDVDFSTAVAQAEPVDCVPVDALDPLYVLYTSGTTGKPKGIVRDNGGHAVAMKFSMQYVYNIQPGDVYWAASDLGWAVGHSYIIYAPLIQGCTTILFEGKPVRTPDAGTFWRIISEHQVKVFFTAPTAFRAIRKEDPQAEFLQKYDLSCLQQLFVAGERCDPSTLKWLQEITNKPIIDHWWQTESGWPMIANMTGVELLPVKPGSATKPVCGFDVQILDEDGQPLDANHEGYVCLKLPLPPGCLPTLWNDDARFQESYLSKFPGFYFSGDGGYKDDDGYVYIMGRVDDVINVAGHRLSTGEMEEFVASHPAVAECAVVGIQDEMRGQRPVAFVVLKDGMAIDEPMIETQLVTLIREQIGAVAYFKSALIVKRLPKTRSGKILRKVMRQIADGESYNVPSTIDDPAILGEIAEKLQNRKIGKGFGEFAVI